MIKTKIKSKSGNKKVLRKKVAKKSKRSSGKKASNPTEVRKDISRIVQTGAKKIAKAVMEQAMTGQLAPAKFLFEVAGVYPPLTDGSQPSSEEECFAQTLLRRLDIPEKPVNLDEDEEAPMATVELSAEQTVSKPEGEKSSEPGY